jgi:uncharacterized protein (DUF305 family)
MRRITMVAATLAAVSGLLLAGCGDTGTEASSTPANASFNDADVEFVQSMIPHHQQAVMMSQMAESAAGQTRVKKLAGQIEAAQAPEIKQMRGWLTAWNVEEADAAGHMAMGHGSDGMDMPGMMTTQQMSDLSSSKGTTFDEMFLTMMIEHHEGAIDMANTVKTDGKNPDVGKLADAIIKGQTAEIATMTDWLSA